MSFQNNARTIQSHSPKIKSETDIKDITIDILLRDSRLYEVDGNIVGLAHYRRMPSPLRGQDIGFLDDLFVEPKHRGQKIGEKLINKMKEMSKSKGWNLVRWITRNDNVRAKSLYDRVSEKTNWDVYELK